VQYGGEYPQLRHAFEMLGCVRVEFKTDSLNAKSRAALLRIGAVEEGTMRNTSSCRTGGFGTRSISAS
jgi:RimJ/RimL family protein N-acetyltransferase